MTRARVQTVVVWLTLLLLAVAALGYFVSPASMLAVVGLDSSPSSDFLLRTIAAAFLAMLPMAWSVRTRHASVVEGPILFGLALYMMAGSAVDLHAYMAGIVGPASVPSVIGRTILGCILGWLAIDRR